MDNGQVILSQSNVLIVDDCSSNVEVLTMMLKQKEYNVINASSGELALQLARENPPDMILLNINIPDMDGYQVCKILKFDEILKEIPVIFISTHKETIDKAKIFGAGGIDYITSPFNHDEVFARVGAHLKLRAQQHELKKLDGSFQKLKRMNNDLENKVLKQTQQMEEITLEVKEFNVLLEEEITEHIKTEGELRAGESQFRNSIVESPVPVMIYAEDGEIIKISRTWTDITGYTIKDIPTIYEWAEIADVFKEDVEGTNVNKVFNLEKRQNDEASSVRTRAGNVRIWDFYPAYIGKLQDGRKLLMKVAIDITDRKRVEELQKKVEEEKIRLNEVKEYDRIKTEFFANISHELRTPINVIFSALQIHELKLKDCSFKSSFTDIYKYTNIMKQNCYRLLRLVNNLIDITKIDSGYLSINQTNDNIVNLIENITLSVVDYVESKGLSIIFDTDVEEKTIACDSAKIERIILNLLSNGVKFTSSGGNIMVSIEDGVENICIRVKDTGRGIPPDKLNTIFERFVQVDKSLTRDHEGSGIGLSLVKALVELHGGTISVKSQLGYGSEFIIYIPCRLLEQADKKNTCCESIVEIINIEFSDIYDD